MNLICQVQLSSDIKTYIGSKVKPVAGNIQFIEKSRNESLNMSIEPLDPVILRVFYHHVTMQLNCSSISTT